jgi:hypothetical protein
LVFFESPECEHCHAQLGFSPDSMNVVALGPDTARCNNHVEAGCNWLVAAERAGSLCASCLLTRTRPNDADLAGDPDSANAYVSAEAAKRRLIFQLLDLGLPGIPGNQQVTGMLAFDLLLSIQEPVTIGHADGIVTIDLAESFDDYREHVRRQLGEPYRTMLGHMRHEVGHYYWQVLVSGEEARLGRFRDLFGDERVEYSTALEHHYSGGEAPVGWEETHVSAYATAHPWEDWAETFAHYLHIRDTLQTAASFGVSVDPTVFDPDAAGGLIPSPDDSIEELIASWIPLASALNAINRSMGHSDAYPFVLSLEVMEKLAFVHEIVRTTAAA